MATEIMHLFNKSEFLRRKVYQMQTRKTLCFLQKPETLTKFLDPSTALAHTKINIVHYGSQIRICNVSDVGRRDARSEQGIGKIACFI